MKNKAFAIGASAGGLAPISELFKKIKDNKHYYFIAQHFNPDSKSLLVQILSRVANHKIQFIEDKQKLTKGVFYILPPERKLFIKDEMIWSEPEKRIGVTPSIDNYLECLSDYFTSDLVALILSGTGGDGTKGARDVIAQKGKVFVQNLNEAKFSGMPYSALSNNSKVKELKINQMIEYINLGEIDWDKYEKEHENIEIKEKVLGGSDQDDPLNKLLNIIRKKININFFSYRPASIERRLEKYLMDHKFNSIESFLNANSTNDKKLEELANYLLIPVTAFFRDGDAFEYLTQQIKKQIHELKEGELYRVWVPASSVGKEVYSIALILELLKQNDNKNWNYKIFATDISDACINVARKAEYPLDDLAEIPHEYMRYVDCFDTTFKIKSYIREHIVFSNNDLLQHPPFPNLNLISCRNLLIYFNLDAQNIAFNKFHHSLNKTGLLFLGRSENLRDNDKLFYPIESKFRIFKKIESHRPNYMLDRSYIDVNYDDYKIQSYQKRDLKHKKQSEKTSKTYKDYIKETITPVYIICTPDWDIIDFNGNVDPFLSFNNGPKQTKLLLLLKEELHGEFSYLSSRLKNDDHDHIRSIIPVKMREDSKFPRVSLELTKIKYSPDDNIFHVVSFHAYQTDDINYDHEDHDDKNINSKVHTQLQLELDSSRHQLAQVIEEAEGTNEELQSMNEELQASNEELQSTNEELESTNEELLASNEELKNVNIELENKSNEVFDFSRELEAIFDHISSNLILLDENLNILRYNQRSALNYPVLKDSIGRHMFSLNLPSELLSLKEQFSQTVVEGGSYEINLKIENEYYILKYTAFDQGLKNHLVVSFFHITELMSIKNKLEKSQRLSSSFFENTSGLVEIKDIDGRYQYANGNFCKAVGVEIDHLVGNEINDYLPKRISRIIRDIEEEVILKKTKFTKVVCLPTVYERKYFLSNYFPIWDKAKSRIDGIGIVSFDITDRIEMEEKLKKNEEVLTQNTKLVALGELFSSIGHELNNPLNAILIQTSILNKQIMRNESHEKLFNGISMIERLTDKATGIINSIKLFSRDTSIGNKIDISFANIWDGVMILIQHRLMENNIDVELKIPMDIKIYCYPGDLELVIVNLLTNAIDALVDNEVKTIKVFYKVTSKEFKIFFEDNGYGVRQDFQDQLFQPFRSTKAIGKGSGLGLSLCYGIMQRHGGSIDLDSAGDPTRFVLSLPRSENE